MHRTTEVALTTDPGTHDESQCVMWRGFAPDCHLQLIRRLVIKPPLVVAREISAAAMFDKGI
jgi:hypothetical protein